MDIQCLNIEESLHLARVSTQAYYGTGRPILTDAQFNELIEHIKQISPESTIPYSVGFGYRVDGVKKPHRVQTSGLPKVKEGDDIPRPPTVGAHVTPKYDGLCVVAYYRQSNSGDYNILEEVLTRGGDEGSGKPVTHNLLAYLQQKGWDKVKSDIHAVAMEVVISMSSFLSLPDALYELPRSAASGILQSRALHEYAHLLETRPYRVYKDNGEEVAVVDKESERYLKEMFGEDEITATEFTSIPELKAWSHSTGYPTDGVVLWDEVAIKFETDTVITTVIRVERNVSRLGRLVPVLVFTPVRLYGTTVSRCPFVSESWVEYHKVGPGARIKVTKFNEIVPGFVDTVSQVPYEQPRICPDCGGPLHQVGGDLFCSSNCIGETSRIRSFVFTFGGLIGYSVASLNRVLDANEIETFDQFLTYVGRLSGQWLTDRENVWLDHLNRAFTEELNMNYLLCALNLPGIGWKWSQKLAPYVIPYLTASALTPFTIPANVANSLERYKDLILRVYERFTWTLPPVVMLRPVTITGKLSIPREEFCRQHNLTQVPIRESGLLIYSDLDSRSAKMREARLIGARILTEVEFLHTF